MADPLGTRVGPGAWVWLNDLSRERPRSGSWAEQVEPQHVTGVTTNPSIFARAITRGSAYDGRVRGVAACGAQVGEVLQALTTDDVPWACEVSRPSYDGVAGLAGQPGSGGGAGVTAGDGRIVVGAGGLPGAKLAEGLRAAGFDRPLSLIGAEPNLPYEQPPLSKTYLAGKSSFDEARLSYADPGGYGMTSLRIGPPRWEIKVVKRPPSAPLVAQPGLTCKPAVARGLEVVNG